MPNPARNLPSTQKFIEIIDIVDDIVILNGGNACLIIEVNATNFALLSPEEQDAKIYAYASLLNSLSFPIQILIRSKTHGHRQLFKTLDDERSKTQNQALAKQIELYRQFVPNWLRLTPSLIRNFILLSPIRHLKKGAWRKANIEQQHSTEQFHYWR